jgi:hypothetical protein
VIEHATPAAPAPPQPPARQDSTPRRRAVSQRVEFVPREPLAPLGLEPLRLSEILSDKSAAARVSGHPAVHVHIGRLEVQRPAPPAPKPRRSNLLGLDDYLAQRAAAHAKGRGA